eukprot:446686-Amphidinium_carterae.1
MRSEHLSQHGCVNSQTFTEFELFQTRTTSEQTIQAGSSIWTGRTTIQSSWQLVSAVSNAFGLVATQEDKQSSQDSTTQFFFIAGLLFCALGSSKSGREANALAQQNNMSLGLDPSVRAWRLYNDHSPEAKSGFALQATQKLNS